MVMKTMPALLSCLILSGCCAETFEQSCGTTCCPADSGSGMPASVQPKPGLFFAKAPKKKLIECSWSSPDTSYLRSHIREMEEAAPYDGIRIQVNAVGKDKDGKTVVCGESTAFTNKRWEYEWFQPALEDMKSIRFTKFTDNFLQMTTSPGNVGWFDDDGWRTVCHNYALMARFAKESGMVGICLDTESYNKNPLFRFDPGSGKTVEETVVKARQRGQEFGAAMFREYPDMKLFLFSLLENNLTFADNPELNICNPTKYQLYIPFVNGLFDALPPEGTLIEGFGSTGYRIGRPAAYLELRYIFQNRYLKILAPEHKNKLLTQVQMAPGTYLDAYFFKSFWYDGISRDNPNRVDLLQRNLAASFAFADEYAWTWGEKGNWWNWEYPKRQKWMEKSREAAGGGLWEKVAPGVTEAVAKTRSITTAAEDFIRRRNPDNLLAKQNGNFEKASAGKDSIPSWSVWKSDGDLEIVPGKGRGHSAGLVIRNTRKGFCIGNYVYGVKPGQRYIVVGYAKMSGGNPYCGLWITWGASDTHDCTHMERRLKFGEPGPDSFRKIVAVGDVPYGADYLRPTPFVGPLADGEELVLDDFTVYLWE